MLQTILEGGAARDRLEAKMQTELDAARPRLQRELDIARSSGMRKGHISMLEAQRSKADLKPKTAYAAILNAPSDAGWLLAICGTGAQASQRRAAPTTFELVRAIRECGRACSRHPINRPALAAGAFTGEHALSTSSAMQNMEDHALRAGCGTLNGAGLLTPMTINDSFIFRRRSDLTDPWSTLQADFSQAVAQCLGHSDLSFEHRPYTRKPGEPALEWDELLKEILVDPSRSHTFPPPRFATSAPAVPAVDPDGDDEAMPQALESNVNTGGPGALGELGGQCQPTADTAADPGLATPADASVSAVDGSDAARPARPPPPVQARCPCGRVFGDASLVPSWKALDTHVKRDHKRQVPGATDQDWHRAGYLHCNVCRLPWCTVRASTDSKVNRSPFMSHTSNTSGHGKDQPPGFRVMEAVNRLRHSLPPDSPGAVGLAIRNDTAGKEERAGGGPSRCPDAATDGGGSSDSNSEGDDEDAASPAPAPPPAPPRLRLG